MNDRPTYRKCSRKIGGFKICPTCKHRHKPLMRIDGQTKRPKRCIECGTALPRRLTYGARSRVAWYVREFDPRTGVSTDHVCKSSEQADELIRQKVRDFTRDPIQEELIEFTSTLIRRIEAETREDAIAELVEQLGGDASSMRLRPIGWDDARRIICDELRQKGLAPLYISHVERVTADLRTITHLQDWSRVDGDAIARYRKERLEGGWERNGRSVRAVGGSAINGDLATLSAFLNRAKAKGWIAHNPLDDAAVERVKVKATRVDYMPDADLAKLIETADATWLRSFVVLAYYTAARRSDLLGLEWERDIDTNGERVASEGRTGPHIYIRGSKADTPRWTPLHPAALSALEELRRHPVIDRRLFPIKQSTSPASYASNAFAALCVKAGLTWEVERNGATVTKNRWKLHDLRRKGNTDLRNLGASPKERAALLGHRTAAINELHYEAVLPGRERELIDALPEFGRAG